MTIDEAKEREAFKACGAMAFLCMDENAFGFTSARTEEAWDAWLARAAQPVSVSREAFEAAFGSTYDKFGTCKARAHATLKALNIEVDK